MHNVTTAGSQKIARACNKNSTGSRGFAAMRSLIDWCCNAMTADGSRFARFEEELVARSCAPRPASPPNRYAGLDLPACVRRAQRRSVA